MYPLTDWPSESPKLFEKQIGENVLSSVTADEPLTYDDLQEFLESSEKFPVNFPIDTGRCKVLKNDVDEAILLRNANSSYPVLHECVLPLFIDFILHKRKLGSSVERELYKEMTFLDFIDRLLKKRAVMFMGKNDDYILLNGTKGRGKWENIGKDDEEAPPLNLENCLSYDEIKLSAFLSVSSYSYFVNDGNRRNRGVKAENRWKIQDEGVIIGLIGARMKKKGFMEYQDIVIDQKQNNGNGFGTVFAPTIPSIFSGFYRKANLTYSEFLRFKDRDTPGYYNEISKGVFFDNITYSKRVAISIDTLLFEANHRAKEMKTSAFVHVVGIGLGVWKCSTHQEEVFMETFAKRIELLGQHLHNVSDVYFAYFSLSSCCGKYKHGSKIPIKGHANDGIRVFISQRQPHDALVGDNRGKLLVVSYAWDGNSLPGNEFWSGKLASTGDSAAASSTQIAEIHNPHINRNVCARNLKIAARGSIYSFEDYVQSNRKRKRDDGASTSR